jgi:hypothetical protein
VWCIDGGVSETQKNPELKINPEWEKATHVFAPELFQKQKPLDMLQPADSLEDVAQNARRDKMIADCKRKIPFCSHAAVRNWIIERQSRSRKQFAYLRKLRSYQCPICSKWHLTTRK